MPLLLSILAVALCSLSAPAITITTATAAPPPPAPAPPYITTSGCPNNPYPHIQDGAWTAAASPANPDPLAGYAWSAAALAAPPHLQTYAMAPLAVAATTNASSFANLDSLLRSSLSSPASRPPALVRGPGSVRFDFGQELAAWLEISFVGGLPDPATTTLRMSVSEMAVPQFFPPNRYPPYGWKTAVPVRCDNSSSSDTYNSNSSTLRLELNKELYEGVRFGFLHVVAHSGAPLQIAAVRAVAQIQPTNWVGSFAAPAEPLLTRAWYVGAYCVKLNLLPSGFGAILDDRGDRTSFSGDDHPSQAASMAAFGNFAFVNASLWRTVHASPVYKAYALYWTLSVTDYFHASNDSATARRLLPLCAEVLRESAAIAGHVPPGANAYLGWDERLGAFDGDTLVETQLGFRALLVRACRDTSEMAAVLGNATFASTFRAVADRQQAIARSDPLWFRGWGLHALAHAATAGMVKASEQEAVYQLRFADPHKICSWSMFNQYQIIQGLVALGRPAEALAAARLCWGPMLALNATSFWEVSGYGGQLAAALGPASAGEPYPPPVPAHSSGSDSMCHPWSSGITAWLTKSVLLGAGAERLAGAAGVAGACRPVRPLLARVSGSVPTPAGVLQLSIDAPANSYRVVLPPGVCVDLALPLEATAGNIDDDRNSVRVEIFQGPPAAESDAKRAASSEPALQQLTVPVRQLHRMRGLQHMVLGRFRAPGDSGLALRVRVVQDKRRPSPATKLRPPHNADTSPGTWDAPLLHTDTATQGSWRGVYGTAGHILFGTPRGSPLTRLPPYIANASISGGAMQGCWDANVSASAAKFQSATQLPPPASPAERVACSLHSNYISPFAVDLPQIAPGSLVCYNLTVYTLDWDGNHTTVSDGWGQHHFRRQALNLFTWRPYKQFLDLGYASAVQYAPTFGAGVHTTFRVCDSIRLRFYPILGDNAVVSAVFFD